MLDAPYYVPNINIGEQTEEDALALESLRPSMAHRRRIDSVLSVIDLPSFVHRLEQLQQRLQARYRSSGSSAAGMDDASAPLQHHGDRRSKGSKRHAAQRHAVAECMRQWCVP